ncbi:MAG: acyltransferase domain-containing protein [Frankiaceae bacterium]
MLAILFPGQGAQAPGFLAPWLDVPLGPASSAVAVAPVPTVADRLRWWSAVVDLDLIEAGTSWDAERIRDTAVAQPLLVAAALAAAEALLEGADLDAALAAVGVTAGHSVGELAAAAVSRALAPEAALVLVRERGRAMAAAAALEPTGMSAVLGGDRTAVLDRIAELDLTAANHNGAGQIVAAGRLENLEKLAAEPPASARVRGLSVAGAFHTRYMAPATERLAALASAMPVRDPLVRIVSNADGGVVTSGRELLSRLVAQVATPVRWDACMATLGELGVTAVIEMPPAGTLVGLVRRELPGVEALALKSPADLDAARRLLADHGHLAPEPAPAWRVVVSPFGGTFVPAQVSLGRHVEAGTTIATVNVRGKAEPVVTAHAGALVEWLAEADDPVAPGQPLARLHPDGAQA